MNAYELQGLTNDGALMLATRINSIIGSEHVHAHPTKGYDGKPLGEWWSLYIPTSVKQHAEWILSGYRGYRVDLSPHVGLPKGHRLPTITRA